MGQDIHMYLEYKEPSDKRYKGTQVGNPYMNRDYDLFGMFSESGRRGYTEYEWNKIGLDGPYPYKDIPNDLSEFIIREITIPKEETGSRKIFGEMMKYRKLEGFPDKEDLYLDPDFHSFSYMSLEEYKEIIDKYKNYYNYSSYLIYDAFYAFAKVYQDTGYETRVVFWFDN